MNPPESVTPALKVFLENLFAIAEGQLNDYTTYLLTYVACESAAVCVA